MKVYQRPMGLCSKRFHCWKVGVGRFVLLAPLLSFLVCSVHAAGATPEEFLPRIYTNSAGKTLNYRLLLPVNYDPQKSYPVILYLHGAAARGSDNTEPLNW